MSDNEDFTIGLDEVLSWIDKERYQVVGEFEVERMIFLDRIRGKRRCDRAVQRLVGRSRLLGTVYDHAQARVHAPNLALR